MIDFIKPSEELSKYIENYFVVETNSSTSYLPTDRVYPCGNVTLVFHYGNSSKFKKKNSKEYVEPGLVICGQQTGYYDLSLSGKTGMIIVTFKPHGVKPFFNLPVCELSNENIALNDLLNDEADQLEDKLLHSPTNRKRIEILESFLLGRIIENRNFTRIEHAIKLIEKSGGQIKTKELANEVCLGIKQFERLFIHHVGLNPKKYSSIIRFKNVIEMKRNYQDLKMYQLAFDAGYYDQSHFNHDIKSLTDITPKDFFSSIK